MKADMVVIGAGALGLSTALHAALAGRSVVVVERDTAGSQASGRAAGLFKSVQADELRTVLARRSIAKAVSFGDWAGVPLDVARSGSFLIARDAAHKEYLRAEARQSRGWGADVRDASAGELAERVSYYRGDGGELALWCPEDVYIEEPISLVQAYLAAGRLHGVEVLEAEAVDRDTGRRGRRRSVDQPGGRAGWRPGQRRAGAPSAAGDRAVSGGKRRRSDHQGGRRSCLPAARSRRPDVRRFRGRPAAGRPEGAAA
jgi:glycine/D-amino acid oxidase-like deaminating enzyme